MTNEVRVRFAPSPTGGLHLGGVRTVLYNYLFAKHNNGKFILRIEDTDQTRFVEGAEDYIFNCLDWCGLTPDESVRHGGDYGPYKQSERKEIYRPYAEQLIAEGNAYYAFDTPEELEAMRNKLRSKENPNPQYDRHTRMQMRNSLSLPKEEVNELIKNGTPHVVRIKVPENETVRFTDMIRGDIAHDTNVVDDKVILKGDGMPTYHLAVVVDDYLMKITHAFRGEEWLPSAPIHILLWKYLGWEDAMPKWAHLPLILKPDGNGKLSKRDGERLGFPVFAMNWGSKEKGDFSEGFKEKGFLPEAFVNILAVLGWNDGTEQELFSMEELIEKFSTDRIHKGGAKFDYEKAKWYNQQYILKSDNHILAQLVKPYFVEQGITVDEDYLTKVVALVKERCHLLTDFWQQAHFFFKNPETVDVETIKSKWSDDHTNFFNSWLAQIDNIKQWDAGSIEENFSEMATSLNIKKGSLMLPLRIMLVGGKYGPGVFEIAEYIGLEATKGRIEATISNL
ncbi:MAG: glutamate--tRNA ligase [Flavipsychrobacter sp.]